MDLLLFGQHRITATNLLSDQPIFVNVEHHSSTKNPPTVREADSEPHVEDAYASEVIKVIKELSEQESHRYVSAMSSRR